MGTRDDRGLPDERDTHTHTHTRARARGHTRARLLLTILLSSPLLPVVSLLPRRAFSHCARGSGMKWPIRSLKLYLISKYGEVAANRCFELIQVSGPCCISPGGPPRTCHCQQPRTDLPPPSPDTLRQPTKRKAGHNPVAACGPAGGHAGQALL